MRRAAVVAAVLLASGSAQAVTADWGVINGQVVVGSWNSTIQVNSKHYFQSTELGGFRDLEASVPGPGTLALLVAGVGMAVASLWKPRMPAQAA